MSKIDLVKEVLKHSDADIIEFLNDEMRTVRRIFLKAGEARSPESLYVVAGDVSIVCDILTALDRRNKEKDI